MTSYLPSRHRDLTFAGGGYSAAITLTYLLRRLGDEQNTAGCDTPFRITVCDALGRFPKGLAYSEGEHSGAFVITPASEMMPPRPGGGNDLTQWLTENRAMWTDRLAMSRNARVREWLPALIEAADRADFDQVFLPRSVIGWFIEDLVTSAIAEANAAGSAQVEIETRSVTRVQAANDDRLLVTTDPGEPFTTGKLVVAIGSGRFRALLPREPREDRLITSPLQNGVEALRRHLEQRCAPYAGQQGPKVLVIGSSASALDVISVLLDLRCGQGTAARITSISPSGHFPPAHRTIALEATGPADCPALENLGADDAAVSARALYDASMKDRGHLLAGGKHLGEAKSHVYRHVLKLIGRMSAEEKRTFVEVYGKDLSEQFLLTSPIYARLYTAAIAEGALAVIAGKVRDLDCDSDGLHVGYDQDGGPQRDRFDLVIDCSGFEYPLECSSEPLVQSLISDLGARPNRSGHGFVTLPDSFEIAPNAFVLGPLYAGNVDATGVCRWRVENTRGISETARMCVEDLLADMAGPRERALRLEKR